MCAAPGRVPEAPGRSQPLPAVRRPRSRSCPPRLEKRRFAPSLRWRSLPSPPVRARPRCWGPRLAARAGHQIIRVAWRSPPASALGFRLGRIRRLQVCGNQIVREPERCRRIDRIGREISAIVSVPRRATPSPSPVHRRRPWVIGPSVKRRMIPVRVIVAVVVVTPVVVAHDKPRSGTRRGNSTCASNRSGRRASHRSAARIRHVSPWSPPVHRYACSRWFARRAIRG